MAIVPQEPDTGNGVRTVRPAQRYSAVVKFIDGVVDRQPNDPPTSVDIYAVGNHWYCNVRCGDKKTRPMGPYSKREAERIQDIRRRLIAKRGTAGLMFE